LQLPNVQDDRHGYCVQRFEGARWILRPTIVQVSSIDSL